MPPGIGPVGQQVAGLHVVPQLAVQHPPQLLLQLGVVDGTGDLHPAVQVPGHQVGGGQIHRPLLPPAKDIDPGVL